MQPVNTVIILLAALISFSPGTSGQESLPLKYKNSTIYSGIEVGSKGVKMSIVEIGKEAQRSAAFNVLKDTSINSDFIFFTRTTFFYTLNALIKMYDISRERYNIPAEKIFTVFSSGVKTQAYKEEKESWMTALADSFRTRISENGRKMEAIDVFREARLSHLGIIPENRRYTTFLIDIGSGNTKGGYFPNGNTRNFNLFEVSWGTKSVAFNTEKRLGNDKTLSNYRKQLERVLSAEPDEEITLAVNKSGGYNMSDNIAFSGGIAWATATLMFPALIDNAVVPVTFEEVKAFHERIYSNFNTLSPDALARTQDISADKNRIAREARRVQSVFDQQALLSGTGLMLKIMRQFEGLYDKKQFYLIKNGQVGWISAYVDQSQPEEQL